MARYIGLDGFRGGWVAAWIDDDGQDGFDYAPGLARLLSIQHKRAMIDIPIGLKESGHRKCDVCAREWLGSSVFLGARRNLWTFRSQESANRHYWKHEGPGMGISCQLWNIRDKIKEVDDFMTPERQTTLGETHPELIFWTRYNRLRLDKKTSRVGREQRVEILRRLGFSNIERWLGLRFGTGIGSDDLIDACACAIAARDADSLLGENETDSCGLRMEMHY